MPKIPALRLARISPLKTPTAISIKSYPVSKFHSHQFRMASNTPAPRFAEGEDQQKVGSDVETLQQQGWALDDEGTGVKKTFYFKSYFKAISFVSLVGAESAVKKHHPTMTVRFGSVDIHWTTHQPRGLTHKDISAAQHCDNGANVIGAVEAGQGQKCG